MTIQRCTHLKPEDIGTLRTHYGIQMELCAECCVEIDQRLTERPFGGLSLFGEGEQDA